MWRYSLYGASLPRRWARAFRPQDRSRILLEPDPSGAGGGGGSGGGGGGGSGGGGGGSNPPPPAVPPNSVVLTTEQYQALLRDQATAAAAEAEKQRLKSEAEEAKVQQLAAEGKIAEAVKEARRIADEAAEKEKGNARTAQQRADALEAEILSDKKEATIGKALLGRTFVSEKAAAQAQRLLESECEAVRDDKGQVVVRHKGSGKPASEWVKEQLDGDEFAHFLGRRGAGGGSQQGGGERRNGTGKGPDDLNRALFDHEKAIRGQGIDDPSGMAVGLGRFN